MMNDEDDDGTHEHVPRDHISYRCKTCWEELSFNGEWNYWWTKKERAARERSYDAWVLGLWLERQVGEVITICTRKIDHFEADIWNDLFKRKGVVPPYALDSYGRIKE